MTNTADTASTYPTPTGTPTPGTLVNDNGTWTQQFVQSDGSTRIFQVPPPPTGLNPGGTVAGGIIPNVPLPGLAADNAAAGVPGSGIAGPPASQGPQPASQGPQPYGGPDFNAIATPAQWAQIQLAMMGLPTSQSNIDFLVSWAAREGGNWRNTARFNPLNTTLRYQGSTVMQGGNTAGVQSYTDWLTGMRATAQTLQGYSQIMAALRAGDAMQANQTGALGADFRKWSGGGYSQISADTAYGSTTGDQAAISGAAGAGAGLTTPASTTIGQLGIAEAQQKYPELAWMLTIPDIAGDINTWAAKDYSPDEIAAQLQGKPWYQRLGATFFTWIAAQATSPGQAAQTFQEELAAVRQTFTQLGLKPSDQQLQTFAYQALAQDWQNHPELEQQAIAGTVHANRDGTFSVRNFTLGANGQIENTFIGPNGEPAQINSQDFQKTLNSSYIAHGMVTQIGAGENVINGAPVYALINGQLQQGFDTKTYKGPLYTLPNMITSTARQPSTGAESTMTGTLQGAEQTFKAMAAQYMVPISDAAAAQLVQQAVASGTTDVATFAKTYFEAQAKSLYPTMAAAIDAGITPQAYTDPYRQVVAQLLGVSPDSVNMSDPKYMRFITQKDPKTGMPTAMSLYDAQNLVMSDPTYGYMKSQNATDRASALAQGIGELFGKTPSTPAGFSGVQAPRV